jgi:hypothetical protein
MLKISPEAHIRRLFEDIRRARAERSANHVLQATSKAAVYTITRVATVLGHHFISRGSGFRIEGSPPFGEAGVHLEGVPGR